MYEAWRTEIASQGHVTFNFKHQVTRIISRQAKPSDNSSGPVRIEFRISDGDLETDPQIVDFDELILAIDADSCLKLLGKQASWMEKRVLGNVKYLYDVTITHNDLNYMKRVRT